jgi:hypothetical protein
MLSTLPHLENLYMGQVGGPVFAPIPPGGFAALQQLELMTNATNLVNILTANPTHLSSIDVTDPTDWTTIKTPTELRYFLNGWHACFILFARLPLVEVDVTLKTAISPQPTLDEHNVRLMVEPLLSLTQLTSLRLSGPPKMKLSDEDLYTLATALPRLEDLDFDFPLYGTADLGIIEAHRQILPRGRISGYQD